MYFISAVGGAELDQESDQNHPQQDALVSSVWFLGRGWLAGDAATATHSHAPDARPLIHVPTEQRYPIHSSPLA